MADYSDIPAWIALFVGLYAIAAAVGELREPGTWAAMVADLERHPALRFLAGIACLALGAAIYLASPWRPGDWLSVLVSVIGGLMVAEGMVFLAAGERVTGIARKLIAKAATGWAGGSAVIGAALVFIALSRLHTI